MPYYNIYKKYGNKRAKLIDHTWNKNNAILLLKIYKIRYPKCTIFAVKRYMSLPF